MDTEKIEAGWDPSLEIESVQNRPCQPMVMLQTNVLLPHRKDKVREKAFFSGSILESLCTVHNMTFFFFFLACATVSKTMGR